MFDNIAVQVWLKLGTGKDRVLALVATNMAGKRPDVSLKIPGVVIWIGK